MCVRSFSGPPEDKHLDPCTLVSCTLSTLEQTPGIESNWDDPRESGSKWDFHFSCSCDDYDNVVTFST